MKYNIASFFSGAGGLDTGFHNAGFEIIWANVTMSATDPDEKGRGSHEWIIEFKKEPEDMEIFRKKLDENLIKEKQVENETSKPKVRKTGTKKVQTSKSDVKRRGTSKRQKANS